MQSPLHINGIHIGQKAEGPPLRRRRSCRISAFQELCTINDWKPVFGPGHLQVCLGTDLKLEQFPVSSHFPLKQEMHVSGYKPRRHECIMKVMKLILLFCCLFQQAVRGSAWQCIIPSSMGKNVAIQVSKCFMNKFNAQVGTSDSSVSCKVRFVSVSWCGPTFFRKHDASSKWNRASNAKDICELFASVSHETTTSDLVTEGLPSKGESWGPKQGLTMPYPERLAIVSWQQLGLDCIKDRMHIRHYILAIHIDHLLKTKLTQDESKSAVILIVTRVGCLSMVFP